MPEPILFVLINLYIYGLSAAILLAGGWAGRHLIGRGRPARNAALLVLGRSLLLAAVLTGLYLAREAWRMNEIGSWGAIGLFLLPLWALQGLLGGTAVCVCLHSIGSWLRRRTLTAAGYAWVPNVGVMLLSAMLLSLAAIVGGRYAYENHLGPMWQMRPYSRVLSSETAHGINTLYGFVPSERRRDAVITIEYLDDKAWTAQFLLGSVDVHGNITIRLEPVGGLRGDTVEVQVPFEASKYRLSDRGELERFASE